METKALIRKRVLALREQMPLDKRLFAKQRIIQHKNFWRFFRSYPVFIKPLPCRGRFRNLFIEIVEEVPAEEFDILPDLLITENAVLNQDKCVKRHDEK